MAVDRSLIGPMHHVCLALQAGAVDACAVAYRVARIDKRVPAAAPDDLVEERESYPLRRVEPR